jgi:hypothetical protein
MTVYGDAEPEDAWQADDPTGVLLDNVDRRCAILGEPTRLHAEADDLEWLAELEQRLHRLIVIRDQFTERDRMRVDLIAADLAFLRTRLEAASG